MPVPYDPVGALGGTFAPGYTRGNPQSEAAVAAWNAAHLKTPPGFVGQGATFAPGYVGSDPASVAAVSAFTAAHQGQPFTPAPPPPAPPTYTDFGNPTHSPGGPSTWIPGQVGWASNNVDTWYPLMSGTAPTSAPASSTGSRDGIASAMMSGYPGVNINYVPDPNAAP